MTDEIEVHTPAAATSPQEGAPSVAAAAIDAEPLTDRVNDMIDVVLAISAFHDERYNRLARPQPADHARLTELVTRLKALKIA